MVDVASSLSSGSLSLTSLSPPIVVCTLSLSAPYWGGGIVTFTMLMWSCHYCHLRLIVVITISLLSSLPCPCLCLVLILIFISIIVLIFAVALAMGVASSLSPSPCWQEMLTCAGVETSSSLSSPCWSGNILVPSSS